MSAGFMLNTCQVCGAEESLDTLIMRMIGDDEVRRLIAEVLTTSFPLGGMVVRYLRLHKPPKQKLRMDKLAKLLAELVPDIQRAAIERTGRLWVVGPDAWKAALQAVFDAADKGTLNLPLEGNGYLYATLMRMADRSEGAQEREYEASRKHAHVATSYAMKTGPVAIADAVGAALGGSDPTLKALDERDKNAAPMPDALRKRLAELKPKQLNNDLSTTKGTHHE